MVRTLCSGLLLVALTAHADAQPSSAQAEVLFRQGKQLMAAKNYPEACAAFDASQKLDPSLATLLNQADCREQNGQFATAWGLFLDAARQTRTASDAASVQMHKVAGQRAAKLEPKLSKLTIVVAPDTKLPGLEITRNGTLVDPGTWNRTLPVDGGTFTVVAKAPGHVDWTKAITVGGSADAQSVTIPTLAEKPAEAAPTVTAMTSADDDDDDEQDGEIPSSGSSKILPIAFGAGAVALFGGAVAFELSGRSSYDDAKLEPDNAKQKSLWDSANRKRYIAEGMAVAGVACAGVAVWLFVRSRGDSESATVARGVSLEPMFAAGGGGLSFHAQY